MLRDDLLDYFRRTLDDQAEPPLWTDEEVSLYINEAQSEACERAKLLRDYTTAEICTIPVVANQASYPLASIVLDVDRVTLDGRKLEPTSVEACDAQDVAWETRTASRPRHFIYHDSSKTLQLVATPTASGTLQLTVYRLPLNQLPDGDPDAELEISSIYHLRMMEWAFHLAYLKQDADTFDEKAAAVHEAKFAAAFGQRPDANVQRKVRDKRPPVVRMRW